MKKNVLLLVPLILLLSLFLTSCGGDDDDGDEEQPSNNQVETDTGLAVGDDAPAFSLPSSTGDTVSLADYSGQPVLLYFHMAVG